MDDPQPPSSDTPEYQVKRDEVAALRTPPGQEPSGGGGRPGGAFASDPILLEPVSDAATPAARPVSVPPPTDAMPGDAASTPLIPLKEEVVRPTVGDASPNAVIIRPPHPTTAALAAGPRSSTFLLWALVWVLAWAGLMALTINRPFDRKFDWNTSYFSITARNLLKDGFVADRGGLYLTAGDYRGEKDRAFYAGHPPLTAWMLAGWMRLLGTSDAAIRALPLAFSALNLLLLYVLVRRVFGPPAALAATVFCSLLPMTAYYGQIVNMEPFVLTFMLGGAIGYVGWVKNSSAFGFLLLCLCVILGCWTDWPMYVFIGLLAVAHFFRRIDMGGLSMAEGEEDTGPGRPILSTLFLLILPLAVFALFVLYLRENGASVRELIERAQDRMKANSPGYQAPSRWGGYQLLLTKLSRHDNFKELRDWFVSLFTPAALLLALLGAVTWRVWSRRLSIVSGDAARRAAFRIVACLVLTQVIYTAAFPQGAYVHEFWQYYLIVPVAILAAGFCTWLTVAGGKNRSFRFGVFDRIGWSVAALVPILAIGPLSYRLQVLGKTVERDARLKETYAGELRQLTKPTDVILTDWRQGGIDNERGLEFALPWYTDRTILPHEGTDKDQRDTRSIEGIQKFRDEHKDRRILYLWGDVGSDALEQKLNTQFKQFEFGGATLYLIQGEPDPSWKPAGTNLKPATLPTTPTKPAP